MFSEAATVMAVSFKNALIEINSMSFMSHMVKHSGASFLILKFLEVIPLCINMKKFAVGSRILRMMLGLESEEFYMFYGRLYLFLLLIFLDLIQDTKFFYFYNILRPRCRHTLWNWPFCYLFISL